MDVKVKKITKIEVPQRICGTTLDTVLLDGSRPVKAPGLLYGHVDRFDDHPGVAGLLPFLKILDPPLIEIETFKSTFNVRTHPHYHT